MENPNKISLKRQIEENEDDENEIMSKFLKESESLGDNNDYISKKQRILTKHDQIMKKKALTRKNDDNDDNDEDNTDLEDDRVVGSDESDSGKI